MKLCLLLNQPFDVEFWQKIFQWLMVDGAFEPLIIKPKTQSESGFGLVFVCLFVALLPATCRRFKTARAAGCGGTGTN
jgi:hypothetical protein